MLKFLNFNIFCVGLTIMGLTLQVNASKVPRSHETSVTTSSINNPNFYKAEGVVESKKRVRFSGARSESMVVTIRNRKNSKVAIDLGEASDFVRIKEGETKLRVVGQIKTIGNQPLLLASEVYLDGELIKVTKGSNKPLQAE
ncbi:MAG: hypothetical protein CME67_02330 [Halobacteriovoraceae bacterium]|nr:hypothetical protein [Halobacteriovoraceae bacterium]